MDIRFSISLKVTLSNPLGIASILEDSKLSRLVGRWIVWINEKLQLDPLRLIRIRPINLVQSNEGFEKLTHVHCLNIFSSTEV
jgi:hypothetical protein